MLAKIIFCTAVSLALLTVLLLAVLSPVPYKQHGLTGEPSVALSLYIQQPQISSSETRRKSDSSAGALIFHRKLTEGPESTSRVVGKAQGFIIPVEQFAHSAFNLIYLTFDTPDYSGSLSIQAKQLEHNKQEELVVVGGTGSFAFARGVAVFAETTEQFSSAVASIYQVNLQLMFPNQSQSTRV